MTPITTRKGAHLVLRFFCFPTRSCWPCFFFVKLHAPDFLPMSWILKKNRVFKITGSGHGSFVKGFFIRIPVWKFLQPWWVKCSFRLLSKRLAAHCCSSLAGWTSHFSSLIYYFCEYTPRNPTTTYVVSRRVRDWHPMNSCHCHHLVEPTRGFITSGSPTSVFHHFFSSGKKHFRLAPWF